MYFDILIEMLLPELFPSNGLGVLLGDRELLQSLNYDGSYHKWEENQPEQTNYAGNLLSL